MPTIDVTSTKKPDKASNILGMHPCFVTITIHLLSMWRKEQLFKEEHKKMRQGNTL